MSEKQYDIAYPDLPLAVYREIAAHLCQVDGVQTELLPQESPNFDYMKSQVGWLRIQHALDLPKADQERLQQILDFYAQRYGAWSQRSS